MELKKSPKADLENKKGLFLEIGLILSILVVIGAFSYNHKERIVEILPMPEVLVEEQIIEITHQEEKPPIPVTVKPIQVVSEIINIVKNDTKIEDEIEFVDFEDDVIFAPNIDDFGVWHDDGSGDPFIIVEDMPKFQGGDLSTFRTWVGKRVEYPDMARENGITGTVTLKFVIETNGALSNIEVLQSPDRSLTEEAVRVVKLSPKWTPGLQRNKAVRVSFVLPIIFSLEG